ncbi:MAG: hypothetical protein ACLRMN_04985 [Mediterraneibacter gnavus]
MSIKEISACVRTGASPMSRRSGKAGEEHLSENDANHLIFLDESGVKHGHDKTIIPVPKE